MAKKKPPYTTKKKAAQSPAVKAKKGIKKKVVRKPKPETAGLLPPKNMDPEDFEHIAQEFKRLKQQGFTLRQLLAAGHKLLDKYGK